jgi:hypothetical protein
MAMKLVRFDWAMKHLLRDKANYSVLEGFLSVLLNEKVRIKQILSSQANQQTDDDKYNDVDILVKMPEENSLLSKSKIQKNTTIFIVFYTVRQKLLQSTLRKGRLMQT